MAKSIRLIIITGVLLGLSVTLLPLRSYATGEDVAESTIRATIDGALSLTATAHTPGTGYSYSEGAYSGTFNAGASTENLGTTTFEVECNFLTYQTTENQVATTHRGCENGWNVTAESSSASNGYAAMDGTGSNSYKILSNSANGLTSSQPNWLMKVTGVTQSGVTPTPAAAYSNVFGSIPHATSASKTIVTGNTFDTTTTPGTNIYIGKQSFTVTYGFGAGTIAPADTYTGVITYTLAINAAS